MPIAVHLLALVAFCLHANAEPPVLILREALVLESTGRAARAPINLDVLQHSIVTGTFTRPTDGATVTLPDGTTKSWSKAQAAEDGWLKHASLRVGSAFTTVHSDSDRIALLHAQGHGTVYINGEPRAGDPYRAGYLRLPVALKRGDNDFLFTGSRGEIYAALSDPRAPLTIQTTDATLPDLIAGDPTDTWAGVTIINATTKAAEGLHIGAAIDSGAPLLTPLPRVEAATIRKVAVRIQAPAPSTPGAAKLRLSLLGPGPTDGPGIDSASFDLRVRARADTFKRTFISDIDGSVQYYAVNPARPLPNSTDKPAIILSLHGASVEATGQADAYGGKSWVHIVCPTNRRPYGFDWEDWGRLDALEVLADAKRTLAHDPTRIYLTGHSMGGHGSWSLACLRPDLFAATGPSAGWISFQSYSGAPRPESPSPIEELLFRSSAASQTLTMVKNLAPLGVYILHGDADDNVPVAQARQMKEELAKFHTDVGYHEQVGAGHWWENSDEPGAECLDWPPMFDLFARRRLPTDAEVRDVDFTTVNPAVSWNMHWVTIWSQIKPMEPSRVTVRIDPGRRRLVGTTANVRMLLFDLSFLPPGAPITIDLDGTKLDSIPWPLSMNGTLWISRSESEWLFVPPPPSGKSPNRSGPFKNAFYNRAVLVYPTGGTLEENAWGYAKARYDAETFAYRGNGSFDLLPDTAFDPKANPDRNVILYGHADCNRAWKPLLADSPVQIARGAMRIGDRPGAGDDIACLFIRPRPGSDAALVGVVGGTGLPGMRITDRLPYFLSGVAYPDCTVLTPDIFKEGSAPVRAAGFFGNDWSITSGEFSWKP